MNTNTKSPEAGKRALPAPKVVKAPGKATRRSAKPGATKAGLSDQELGKLAKKSKALAAKLAPPKAEAPDPEKPKRGRGRPKTGFDKVKYQREYMAGWRAKQAAKKAKPKKTK